MSDGPTVTLAQSGSPVALVTLDVPGDPLNRLSVGALRELSDVLDAIERDPSTRAAVLVSTNPDSFSEGFSPEELLALDTRDHAGRFFDAARDVIDRVRGAKKPIVAAVSGRAAGAGLELALACRAIVASDDTTTVFALTAPAAGLAPWLGGLGELHERVGLAAATELALSGRDVTATEGKRAGFVLEVASPDRLVEVARRVAAEQVDTVSRAKLARAWRLLGPLDRALSVRKARATIAEKTAGNQPALSHAIAILAAHDRTGDARAVERDAFRELVVASPAKHLMELERATEDLRARAFAGGAPPLARVCVVGGTQLGVRTANALARAGLAVTLLAEPDDAVADVDLVIETTPEDAARKRSVLDAIVRRTTRSVVASTALSCALADVAPATRRDAVVGLALLGPVAEITRLADTSDHAFAVALEASARAGSAGAAFGDGIGRFGARLRLALFAEVLFARADGASEEAVARALHEWGFTLDPLDVARRDPAFVEGLVELDHHLPGARRVAPGLTAFASGRAAQGRPRSGPPARRVRGPIATEELMLRCCLAVVNEAHRCKDEGIVRSTRDADVVAVRSHGFPAFRGGPFEYATAVGYDEILSRLYVLERRAGSRFEPAASLAGEVAVSARATADGE